MNCGEGGVSKSLSLWRGVIYLAVIDIKDRVNVFISVMLDGKVRNEYLIGGDDGIFNYTLIHSIKDIYRELR